MNRRENPQPSEDWMARSGAMALAGQIRDFWRAKGRSVEVWLEPRNRRMVLPDGTNTIVKDFDIRSDMSGGLPGGMAFARPTVRIAA